MPAGFNVERHAPGSPALKGCMVCVNDGLCVCIEAAWTLSCRAPLFRQVVYTRGDLHDLQWWSVRAVAL